MPNVIIRTIQSSKVSGVAIINLEEIGYTKESEERVVKALFDIIDKFPMMFPKQSGSGRMPTPKLKAIKNLIGGTKYNIKFNEMISPWFTEETISLIMVSEEHQLCNFNHTYAIGLGRII